MKLLLGEENNEYFDRKYPLFFKNEKGYSALDDVLDRNQIRSVNMMISYIVKYQNTYVFSNIFKHNFVDLIQKEVNLKPLLESKIFNHTFDYDEWPATNSNTD